MFNLALILQLFIALWNNVSHTACEQIHNTATGRRDDELASYYVDCGQALDGTLFHGRVTEVYQSLVVCSQLVLFYLVLR
mmetsp:Transcript_21238/g.25716  ORF Transcript_21238/g.25716 Transcript_21238/m.25716 type:complete len:80 (-) Transcript_21238:2-241(-)